MLDGLNPIHVLPAGEQVEWQGILGELDGEAVGLQRGLPMPERTPAGQAKS